MSTNDVDGENTAAVSTEDLLWAVGQGSMCAFGQLYNELAPAVMGVVLAVVGHREQAEDVVLAVFVELWRSARSYRGRQSALLPLVVASAHRRAVDHVRTNGHRSCDQRGLGGVEHETSTGQQLSLELLSKQEREAVVLAYYGACTYREVAEILDIPAGVAARRIRSGLRRIRRSAD